MCCTYTLYHLPRKTLAPIIRTKLFLSVLRFISIFFCILITQENSFIFNFYIIFKSALTHSYFFFFFFFFSYFRLRILNLSFLPCLCWPNNQNAQQRNKRGKRERTFIPHSFSFLWQCLFLWFRYLHREHVRVECYIYYIENINRIFKCTSTYIIFYADVCILCCII